MCVGVEWLYAAGAVLGSAAAVKTLTKKAPQAVQTSPLADQAGIEAEARMRRRRQVRGSSLLATGGAGDPSPIGAMQPTAIGGKETLGA